MNLELTEEQKLLRDSVRAFAREQILPKAEEIDHKGVFPQEQFEAMAEMGLMGIAVPEEWGGAGMDNAGLWPAGLRDGPSGAWRASTIRRIGWSRTGAVQRRIRGAGT